MNYDIPSRDEIAALQLSIDAMREQTARIAKSTLLATMAAQIAAGAIFPLESQRANYDQAAKRAVDVAERILTEVERRTKERDDG